MNLTFNQFLEQRDPEIYNQISNEGLGDMAASLGRSVAGLSGSMARKVEYVYKKAVDVVAGIFRPEELLRKIRENNRTISELKSKDFWKQDPQRVEDLIAQNLEMLKKLREDEESANDPAVSHVASKFARLIRWALATGIITAGLIGMWQGQGQDYGHDKHHDTYKGSTSGYMQKTTDPTSPKVDTTFADPDADPYSTPSSSSVGDNERDGVDPRFPSIYGATRGKRGKPPIFTR